MRRRQKYIFVDRSAAAANGDIIHRHICSLYRRPVSYILHIITHIRAFNAMAIYYYYYYCYRVYQSFSGDNNLLVAQFISSNVDEG